MKNSLSILAAAAVFVMGGLPADGLFAAEPTEAERATASRKLVKSFAGRLKGELVGAIKSGGPAAAIPVCNVAAPAIAREKASEKGWSVGRTALRLRNPDNAPDAWERSVLETFQVLAKKGADLARLEHYETVTSDGKRVFRYMKAIPTLKPCLTCHGPQVSPALKTKIREFYPEDRATGFNLGDLRGAFTITQPMK